MLNYAEKPETPQRSLACVFNNENIDFKLFHELVSDSTNLGPQAILTNPKYNSILTPFELTWTFGFDVSVPILNLTTNERKEIFYTACNNGILYNYQTRKMVHFKGHQNKIVCTAVDASGRWLATADNGSDRMILIWDTTTCAILRTIFNSPQDGTDLHLIGLSPNARLLITVTSKDGVTIDFWLWTYARDAPDDTYTDERELGTPKSIEFHPNKEDHVMIVFEHEVLLFIWDYEKQKLAKTSNPKIPPSSSIGHNTDGTYVDCCHECFVTTSKGCILVFGNTIFAKEYAPEELDNDKFYVKSIKTQKVNLTCIKSTDELIVTADSNGKIMFFDKRIKLLYWFSGELTKSIKSMSFTLNPRKIKFVRIKGYSESIRSLPSHIIDHSDEYERIVLENLPTDATIDKRPFISRDCFLSTMDGTIYKLNFVEQTFVPLFTTVESNVAAIDVHDELPYLIVAYSKGHLVLYNYETHQTLLTSSLPEAESDVTVTAVKYSHQGLHLACGRSNGELWLLQPTILTQIYVEPFQFSFSRVVKIVFSKNSLQMAYFDSNMTVFAFYYDVDSEDWIFKGKVRSHYKDICNILYLDEEPSGFYTVGQDRHLIRYTDVAARDEELDVTTRDRIDQKDIPVYFTPYPKGKHSKSGYFLITDDKHKFKIINSKTTMCTAVYLGPAYGCFKDSTIRKIEFLPNMDKKYLIFMTKKLLGMQLMPIDGNPFKYIGCLAHPEELQDFQMSCDGKYVFTVGKNDRTLLMWKVKPMSVETLHVLGGVELQPFYCLLEGGRSGFIYQEMQDLFYYMQILQQGEQIPAERIVSNYINLGEVPDLMRACGYYPTEYEIENALTDLRYKDFDENGTLQDKVSFCDFVKLFINHKPAYGYTIDTLEEAFETITTFAEDYGGEMSREDFIEATTTTGEQVGTEQIFRCLTTLLHVDADDEEFGERDFSFLPDNIDFDYFAEEILGIDTTSLEREKDKDDYGDDDGGYYSSYFR